MTTKDIPAEGLRASTPPRRSLATTALLAALVAALLGQAHAGFMVLLLLLLLVPWSAWSLAVALRRVEERRARAIRLGIWWLAVGVVLVTHGVRHHLAERAATRVSDSIVAYMKAHGRCPATLEEVGSSPAALRQALGMSHYRCDDGRPVLFYASTLVPFETEDFDFESGRWEHRGD